MNDNNLEDYMKHFGYSVFPSTWRENQSRLKSEYIEGSMIFTSLHIAEEFSSDYVTNCIDMLKTCKSIGYKILADVSPRTLGQFGYNTLSELREGLEIDILRIDYGFSLEAVVKAAREMPICINASTVDQVWIDALSDNTHTVYALHNYYPRPDTGLDSEQFIERNANLKAAGITVMAFIAGDLALRGPIHEGLPTLEHHRTLPPYVAYTELSEIYDLDWIIVGDGFISEHQVHWIRQAIESGYYYLPSEYEHTVSTVKRFSPIYTIRPDSPKTLIRLQESREYATQGQRIEPRNCVDRTKGTITIDNVQYLRYSGEIQITRADYPSDPRVNVIGSIIPEYYKVLKALPNGAKIKIGPLE